MHGRAQGPSAAQNAVLIWNAFDGAGVEAKCNWCGCAVAQKFLQASSTRRSGRGRARRCTPAQEVSACLPSHRATIFLFHQTRVFSPILNVSWDQNRVGKSGRNPPPTSARHLFIGRSKECATQSYSIITLQPTNSGPAQCSKGSDTWLSLSASDSSFASSFDQATGEPLIVGVLLGLDKDRVNYRSGTPL